MYESYGETVKAGLLNRQIILRLLYEEFRRYVIVLTKSLQNQLNFLYLLFARFILVVLRAFDR
jgi:hypothetical protein